MKALLLKDILVLSREMKILLVIVPLIALSGGVPMATIAVLIGAALPMTAIGYDEQSKWDELAAMMPYSKKSLVFSKYVLGYLCMVGAAVLFLAAHTVLALIRGESVGAGFSMVLFPLIAGLLLIAVNIPIMLKFGTQKGRIAFIILMATSAAAGGVLNELISSLTFHVPKLLPAFVLAAVLLLNVGSVQLSFRIKHS